MDCHKKIMTNSLARTLAIVIIASACSQLALALPISNRPDQRALRSVEAQIRNSWNASTANLLLPQKQQHEQKQQNDTDDPILARREIQTGDGTSDADDDGDGSNEVEIDGGDGTFSNDTRTGSRLKKNETCSLEPASLCSPVDSTHSNRDKQRRIAHIVNFLWTNVFGNRTRQVNKEIRNQFNPSSGSFSGGFESIPASCDLPSEIESEAWSSERYFSVYFNLSSKYPTSQGPYETSAESTSTETQQQPQREAAATNESGHSQEYIPTLGSRPFFTTLTVTPTKSVNVISAKLRLYKIGTSEDRNNVPSNIERTPEPCNDTDVQTLDFEEEVVPSVFPITRMTPPEFTPSVDEKIRVSVFWYTQPATKNHYKKKLVDTKMVTVKESSWVEFDIKNAVTAWLNERKPNFGLVIEVENENQDVLNPRNYFRSASCFGASASEGELAQNGEMEKVEGNANPAMSPTIEICTLNVPETRNNYEHTKFLPYSTNINSLAFLNRVAETHAKANNTASRPTIPQNVNLRGLSPEMLGFPNPNANRNNGNGDGDNEIRQTIVVPSHRHRHHHHVQNGSSSNGVQTPNKSSRGNRQHQRDGSHHHTQPFFGEDHPLRQILASVSGNSKESSRRVTGSQQFQESFGKGFPSHQTPDMPADEGKADDDYSTEQDRDVFITKIIISPAQLMQNGGRLAPFLSSLATSAPSSTGISPTVSTKSVDSSER